MVIKISLVGSDWHPRGWDRTEFTFWAEVCPLKIQMLKFSHPVWHLDKTEFGDRAFPEVTVVK